MRRLTGTIIFCHHCGNETRKDMVSVNVVNDLRDAATTLMDILEDDQTENRSPVYEAAVAKLRKLC